MNDQLIQAILQMLSQGGLGQGAQNQSPGGPQQPSVPTGQQPCGEGLNPLASFSPVNLNPNYASTVGRFFNTSPLAGGNRFQGRAPVQSGLAGNNAARGGSYWSTLSRPDHNATMQSILQQLQR